MTDFQVISIENDEQALTFLESHGGVFHRQALLSHCDSLLRLGIRNKQGEIIGGFNLERIKLKGITTLAAPAWHPHCALFTLPFQGGHTRILSQRKKVIEAVADFLRSQKEKVVSVPFPPEWTDMQPFIWAGFTCSPKYTYRLDLQGTEDITERYAPKVRANVRKCGSDGLIIEPGRFETFLTCLTHTAENAGFNIDENRLRTFVTKGENAGIEILTAWINDKAVAANLTASDEETCYYLFGGMDRSSAEQNGLTCVLHASIQAAKQKGLSYFDFEGSMIPGVEAYFRSFGGDQLSYFLISKAPLWMLPLLRLRGRTEF